MTRTPSDQLRAGVRARRGHVGQRCAAVGLVVLAWMAPVWAFGAQAASGAQVIYKTRAPARAPAKAPSRTPAKALAPTPAHAPTANSAPPANSAPSAKGAPAAKTPPAKGPKRAPSNPPLGSGGTGLTAEEEASASASPSGGDPLVDNGLGSPLCGKRARSELSLAGEHNCRSSDFEAAQAPTGDYAFDVHINTGVSDWGNDLSASVQNAAQWGWILLVAIVHGVIVMLEWSYTVDLLNSSAMGAVTKGLSETQATFTRPWLVLALAVAAVLALYHGIVRRQVSETLGQVVLMGVMMLAGFWVIVNPLGTVGALGAWANQASLGTLGAVVAGTPGAPDRTLAESMESVFSGTIGGPWCYLEFGDVRWCEDPVKSTSPLGKAAHEIAANDQETIGSQSVELLRDAKTNGDLFLALPANGEQRNSINPYGPFKNENGLFNVLCGGSEEPCHGPTAGEAEFRTQHGTAARVIGLFLIWIGVLGMVLLLGYLAMHLLGAAIASLFLLLLAPAAVIAPALGDGGRGVFRRWGTWLLGAVCSKLIFSFLLGVVLLMQQTLMKLTVFGWWAQWLLVSAMWWGAFCKRHQVLGFVHGEHRSGHASGSLLRHAQRAREKLHNPPALAPGAKWAKGKLGKPPPSVERRRKLAQAGLKQAKGIADGQVGRALEREHGEALALVRATPQTEARISDKQTQLEQAQGEHATAQAKAAEAGKARKAALRNRRGRPSPEREKKAASFAAEEKSQRQHAAELQRRMGRLRGEIADDRGSLAAARQTVKAGAQAKLTAGNLYTRAQAEKQARFLDAQAARPPGERDYAGAAGIANYGRREYEALDARGKQVARREIDQELAVRKGASAAAREVAAGGEGSLKRREQQKVEKQFGRSLEQEVQAEGHELPASLKPRPKRPGFDAHLQDWRSGGSNGASRVMHDAREVIAGRKRQLGRERRR
jgi:hypothetical protein